jgi:hypothetical protein
MQQVDKRTGKQRHCLPGMLQEMVGKLREIFCTAVLKTEDENGIGDALDIRVAGEEQGIRKKTEEKKAKSGKPTKGRVDWTKDEGKH